MTGNNRWELSWTLMMSGFWIPAGIYNMNSIRVPMPKSCKNQRVTILSEQTQRVFHAEFWHGIFPSHAKMRIPRQIPRQNSNPTPNPTPKFRSHAQSHAFFWIPREIQFGMGSSMGFSIPRQIFKVSDQNPMPNSVWHEISNLIQIFTPF